MGDDYELLIAAGFPRKAAAVVASTPGVTTDRIRRVIAAARQRVDLSNPIGWMRDRLVNGWDLDEQGHTEWDREALQRRRELAAALTHSDQETLDHLEPEAWDRVRRKALATFAGDMRAGWFARATREAMKDQTKWGELRAAMAGIARADQAKMKAGG